ncbi:MAG: chemoreceptor glutamine deamidase CheD [Methylococcales bacterium]|nr:chemoreceptor glutamine deamidase CheD [Methylococcales bacterium]MBT7410346.1 chemoreceptor glutamine deamidase CheD [Methylococcales bacterium]
MKKDEKIKTLPGFEHINHYWDPTRKVYAAKILPGQFYVSNQSEIIVTTLGSCISACIRDEAKQVGGMNHFMLPISKNSDFKPGNVGADDSSHRYGNFAMEALINEILKFGGRKSSLEVKVFGGGKILSNMSDIGKSNIEFVKEFLNTENLKIISSDVGNVWPRKVAYYPLTGKVMVKRIKSLKNNSLVNAEKQYISSLEHTPVTGDIELFD